MKTKRMYTQGVTKDMEQNGSFDVVEYGMLNVDQAISLTVSLPVPHIADYEPKVCPPAVGFSEKPVCSNICRTWNGSWFVWPGAKPGEDGWRDSRKIEESEVEDWVRSKYKSEP